ncbi:MAG: phosphoribosylformylglycinamidine cyclo-ligase, partial [Melioribacteraceae bacterium]|nr:phosphoribosylformylglycinamidine cyclo-ligase [Melioribacteraceae bacterium]
MNSTYRAAGVDIKAGEETVDKIKDLVKATHNKNVLTGIGHFGSFFELDTEKYKRPVMVSSVDGVGTKLKIAFVMDKHDTVGQDLVNHCVNDIAVCGADPLYFMDYLAFGKLIPTKAEAIIAGFAKACSENGVALVGGETAEMPGLYDENEYDMSGTIVGVVEKDQIIDGSNVKEGDILIGFPSTGLHTNGYSLARKVLFEKFTVNQKFPEIESTLGDLLLAVHKSYLNEIRYLKSNYNIHGFSHITGGGIIGNTKRVVPNNLKIEMDWNSW